MALPIGGITPGTCDFFTGDRPRIVFEALTAADGGVPGGPDTPGGTGIGGGARPATVVYGCFGMSCSVVDADGTTGDTSVRA